MRNIVLNIPHASVNGIFSNELGRWTINPHFVNDHVRRWTDWFTDMLFASRDPRVTSVVFPYSRYVCDVERVENDPRDAEGQGIIYTQCGGYQRGEIDEKTRERLLALSRSHLEELTRHLSEDSLLIDCHSFPSDIANVDICIGFNNDWSYDGYTVDLIKRMFEKSGYRVALNAPYSGSITPPANFPYKSVMIEVNKRVYMDENLILLNRNSRQWMRWFGCLNRIYNALLNQE